MFHLFRKYGPVLMVPAAWITATAAVHTDLVSEAVLMIAHAVMAVLMSVFLTTGWKEMDEGVLNIWRSVILVGLPVTLIGAAGLNGLYPELFKTISITGWMLLPGLALVYTGLEDREFGTEYTVSGFTSLLGLYTFFIDLFIYESVFLSVSGLSIVLLGQSAGILFAAYQNS